VKILCKANKQELSPYNSINQYIDEIEKYTHETTKLLINSVIDVLGLKMKKAHPNTPLIFKGRIIYHPGTGKPITIKEWRKLEDSLAKFLKIEKEQLQKKINDDSYWLGSLLKKMSLEQRKSRTIKSINLANPNFTSIGYNSYDKDLMLVTERLSGIYLQNVTEKAQSKIKTIITEDTKQRKPGYKLFQDLWDQEEDINRDWDRVVRTEIAMNANNGILITTLRTSDEEHTFVKGISAPNACPYCREFVANKIALLLPAPPTGGGDQVTIDGKTYTAIWPGKSNFGRKPADYWAASHMHPYCRCTWTEWYPELEKYFKE